MNTKMLLEIFGYIGSAMVVVSMLMTSIVKLRIINTIGSVISCIYALLCGATPLALMNACLIVINITGLVKLLKTKKDYSFVIGHADGSLIKFFLQYYEEDIKKYFPHFDREKSIGQKAYFICHEGVPAGVLLGSDNNGTFEVNIDYTTTAYRDCSVAKYLYSKIPDDNVKKLRFSHVASEAHKSYMAKMGYVFKDGAYEKTV